MLKQESDKQKTDAELHANQFMAASDWAKELYM